MGRILEFIRYPSHSRTLGLLAFLVVLLAIPLTVNIAQKQQELRQRAAEVSVCEQKGGICPQGSQGPCYVQGAQYDAWSCSPTCTPTQAVSCNPACGTPQTCGKPSTCIDDCGNTYQGQCDACPTTPAPASTQSPATPAPTQAPATAAPATPQTVATSCPGNSMQIIRFGNGNFGWGGSCDFNNHQTQLIPGDTCHYEACEQYNGGPATCWFSGQLSGPGLNTPCNTPTPTPTPTPTATASPGCTEASRTPCLAPANFCGGGNGVQTVTYTGSTCTIPSVITSCPSAVDNCSSGNVCPSGNGQKQCVAQSSAVASPTPPPSGSTVLTFSNIGLNGLGQNTGKSGSQNPPSTGLRSVTVQVLDASGAQVTTPLTGSIIYNGGSWTTGNSISAPGTTLPNGSYIFKLKTANYIQKSYAASITGGQANSLSNAIALPTGDINGNGTVDINDVNLLISCSIYSADNGAACGANSSYKGLSDLNNDGRIDQYDYNLILREFGQSDQ